MTIWKITKGNNYAKNVVVNRCTSSGHALYFYQFCEINLNGIKVIDPTRFHH